MAQTKLVTPWYTIGGNEIAKNSLSVKTGDPIAIKSGFADKAVAGDRIVGISVETKVFEATNQTTVKEKLEFFALGEKTMFDIDVATATIAQANIGQTYNLNASSTVDGSTAGTGTQVRLMEVISTTRGRFSRV